MLSHDTMSAALLILIGLPLLATFGALIGGALLTTFGLVASGLALVAICIMTFITPAMTQTGWVLAVTTAPALGWLLALVVGRRYPR